VSHEDSDSFKSFDCLETKCFTSVKTLRATEHDGARTEMNEPFRFDCKSCFLLAIMTLGMRNILLSSLLFLFLFSSLFRYTVSRFLAPPHHEICCTLTNNVVYPS